MRVRLGSMGQQIRFHGPAVADSSGGQGRRIAGARTPLLKSVKWTQALRPQEEQKEGKEGSLIVSNFRRNISGRRAARREGREGRLPWEAGHRVCGTRTTWWRCSGRSAAR